MAKPSTTIWVWKETKDLLHAKSKPGESDNDTIRRLIEVYDSCMEKVKA